MQLEGVSSEADGLVIEAHCRRMANRRDEIVEHQTHLLRHVPDFVQPVGGPRCLALLGLKLNRQRPSRALSDCIELFGCW